MRLALADVKKRVLRRGGESFVLPHLLKPKELLAELAALIALYDAWVGESRATFPADRPAELIGDYRLARCLTNCLSEWYEWRSPAWPGTATVAEAAALAATGITSPSHLRLALYDAVNRRGGGYLANAEREQQLDTFAAEVGLARTMLDSLLRLDEEQQAILVRTEPASPTARELTLRYNQRAVEALLYNASLVEWLLPATMTDGAGGGLGTVLKRICFLARQMGVRYDVAFADDATANLPHLAQEDELPALRVAEQRHEYLPTPPPPSGAEASPTDGGSSLPSSVVPLSRSYRPVHPSSAAEISPHGPFPTREGGWGLGLGATPLPTLDGYGLPLRVTLYGPQEVMGAANQYGERLARLCRMLLGYRRAVGTGSAALAGEGLRGSAQVYLYGRPTTFILDERLLHLLGVTAQSKDTLADDTATNLFDSTLERDFAADFAALEQAGEAHGWRLEREPEPVLADDTILVPDFALTRGQRRVYLEVAGYWRPGYRERKVRKLAALRQRVSMIVAAPESARAEFAALVDDFPFLWYNQRLSVQAMLDVLDRDFNDAALRLAQLDSAAIHQEAQRRGYIPARESMALLHVYTRNELAKALAQIDQQPGQPEQSTTIFWLEGIGLCSEDWRTRLLTQIANWLAQAPEHTLSLPALHTQILAAYPELATLTEPVAESLAQLAGCTISRSSIFQVEVLAPGVMPAHAAEQPSSSLLSTPARSLRTQPRTAQRRKHSRTPYETPTIFPLEAAEEDI